MGRRTPTFKDHTFDFHLSAHVIEHTLRPEHFLEEAMRVSRRGFLSPSEFCERVLPLSKHLWLISADADGTLVLRQKSRASESEIPGVLHEAWSKDRQFRRFFDSRPDLFQVLFAWQDRFAYRVHRYSEDKPEWLAKATLEDGGPADGGPPSSPRFDLTSKSSWVALRIVETGAKWKARPSLRLVPTACVPGTVTKPWRDWMSRSCAAGRGRHYRIRPDGIPVMPPVVEWS
jgi:hypothetical protein